MHMQRETVKNKQERIRFKEKNETKTGQDLECETERRKR